MQKRQTMHKNESEESLYIAFAHKYENTIKGVACNYCPHGGYLFHSLICDLTTHLWQVYPLLPPGVDEHDEAAWVFTVLNNKARNLLRNERLHHSLIEYRDSLPDVAAEEEEVNLTTILYEYIASLDDSDKKVLEMYLKSEPLAEIGKALGGSNQRATRRLNKIRQKLCEIYRSNLQ